MTRKKFDGKLDYGQNGEALIDMELMNRGFSILQSSHGLGKQETSPRFIWNGVQYPHLPEIDFLVSLDEETKIWADAKRKPNFIRFRGETRIGYGRDSHEKYMEIQRVSGIDAYIFFVIDEEPNAVFFIELDKFDRLKKPWIGSLDLEMALCKENCWYINKEHLEVWELNTDKKLSEKSVRS